MVTRICPHGNGNGCRRRDVDPQRRPWPRQSLRARPFSSDCSGRLRSCARIQTQPLLLANNNWGTTMFDLDQAIRERHSTRMFLPRAVPRDLVNEALALAQWAPSNSNIQPWRLVLVSGAARDRLKDALFKVADHDKPD